MKSMTCVLAIRPDSLLNRALAGILLTSKDNLRVINSHADDLPGLLSEVDELKPDVVLLGESLPLAAKDILGHLLMNSPEMRVIVVSEDTNWLHVFDKQEMLMTRQSDLLELITVK